MITVLVKNIHISQKNSINLPLEYTRNRMNKKKQSFAFRRRMQRTLAMDRRGTVAVVEEVP
jgi:hypothetical protein